jgi:hypothetical protein
LVQRAVHVVARYRENLAPPGGCLANDKDLAIGLDGNVVGPVEASRKVGRDLAVVAERRIGRAVGEQARDRKIVVAGPCNNDRAVRGNGDCPGQVVSAVEIEVC